MDILYQNTTLQKRCHRKKVSCRRYIRLNLILLQRTVTTAWNFTHSFLRVYRNTKLVHHMQRHEDIGASHSAASQMNGQSLFHQSSRHHQSTGKLTADCSINGHFRHLNTCRMQLKRKMSFLLQTANFHASLPQCCNQRLHRSLSHLGRRIYYIIPTCCCQKNSKKTSCCSCTAHIN